MAAPSATFELFDFGAVARYTTIWASGRYPSGGPSM